MRLGDIADGEASNKDIDEVEDEEMDDGTLGEQLQDKIGDIDGSSVSTLREGREEEGEGI